MLLSYTKDQRGQMSRLIIYCVCVTAPFSERASFGLNHSEVPQGKVPAGVSLLVAVHLNGHSPLGQELNKLLRHRHREFLTRKQRKLFHHFQYGLIWIQRRERLTHLSTVKDHCTLRVPGRGGGGAACRHLWSDKHRLLLAPEVVLTENKV